MSLLNGNISIKIKNVQYMTWDCFSVYVAPRQHHALVFRIEGDAVLSHDKTTINAKAGDITYMPANYDYYAQYKTPNRIFVIDFESDVKSEMENYCLETSEIILNLFESANKIWKEKKESYYYKTMSAMCEILNTICMQNASNSKNNTLQHIEIAFEYMQKNYTQCDFSIGSLVSMAHMSDTYFRKKFFEKTGMTPIKYLLYLRLKHAEMLLSTGKYSVKEAAEMSGFSDEKYFSRIIKKEFGFSPSKLYRHIR